MRLTQLIAREKDLRKALKSDTKGLRKALKKFADLDAQTITMQLDDILERTAEYFRLGAMRTWSDAHHRADVVVDGEPLVRDVPIHYLLLVEKQLGYVRDLIERVPAGRANGRLDAIGERVEAVHAAVRFARQETNDAEAAEPPFGRALMRYVLTGEIG